MVDEATKEQVPGSAEEEVKGVKSELAQKIAVQRLKMVTGDLIDLWLYEGSKGLNYLQASQAYQYTDQYVHYADTYETVKTQGKSLADRMQEKVIFFYDEASNFVGMLIKVLSDRQSELVEYV